jgi:hypothetical protein
MNVRELIEELSRHNPEMEVGFGFVYPDYWRSTLVKEINHIEPVVVRYSDYHGCNALASEEDQWRDNDDEDGPDLEGLKEVLTISSMRLV